MVEPAPDSIDGHEALRLARRLSFARFPGTSEETRARRHLGERMRELGYTIEEQPFRYDPVPADRLRRLSALLPVLLIGGFALLFRGASPGEWAALTTGMPVALFLLRWPWLERLFEGTREASANLIARRAGTTEPARPRVLFMAHVDSKSQALSLVARGVLATTLLLTAVVGWALLGIEAAGFSIGSPFSVVVVVFVLLGCGLPLALNANGNDSPGALDNAAGCAVLLEIARAVKDARGLPFEPVFAFTGAEEVGMVGAARLARTLKQDEEAGSWRFINFDGPGCGTRLLGLAHGPGRSRLLAAGRAASEDSGVAIRFARLIPAAGVDGVPLGAAGLPGITVLSGSAGPAVRAVHRPEDRWENLDPLALAAAGKYALALAKRLV